MIENPQQQPEQERHGGGFGPRYVDENMLHPERDRADAKTFPAFDWKALESALGESEQLIGPDWELAAQGIIETLRFICAGVSQGRLDLVGRRCVAALWVLSPTESAADLAKHVGCHRAMLSEDAVRLSRRFGVRNRAQRHGWNFRAKEDDELQSVEDIGEDALGLN